MKKSIILVLLLLASSNVVIADTKEVSENIEQQKTEITDTTTKEENTTVEKTEDLDTILKRMEKPEKEPEPKISKLADKYVKLEVILDNENLPVMKEKLQKRYREMYNRYVYKITNIQENPLQLINTNIRSGKSQMQAAMQAVKIHNKGLFAASFIPVFGSIAAIANAEKSMGNLDDTQKLTSQAMANNYKPQIFTEGDYIEFVVFTAKDKKEPDKKRLPKVNFTLFDLNNQKYISFTK